jgi:hypothetical protein
LLLALSSCTPDPESDSVPTAARDGGEEEARKGDDLVVASVGPLQILLPEVLTLTRDKEAGARAVRPGDTVEDVRREIRRRDLRQAIDRRLLILEAARHPELVSDASLSAEVKRRLIELGPEEIERRKRLARIPQERFQEDFRKLVREDLMTQEIVRREVDEKLALTEEEMRERYDRDREDLFRRPDSWALYHIVQYLPSDRKDELPELIRNLEEIHAHVSRAIESATNPKACATLMAPFVKEHSHDPSAASGHVFLYDTPKADFDPALVERVKASTLGQLSEVFELAGDEERVGACFLLTFEHRPEEYAPYERVERILRADMLEEKRKALFAKLFEKLKGDFPVTIHEDHLFCGLDWTGGN